MSTRLTLFFATLLGIVFLFVIDRTVDRTLPHFERLRDNFSAQYVRRELTELRGKRPIVVLGDSVLWGFGVAADRSAISLLSASVPAVHNLAYPGGSPLNSLTMFDVLLRSGVKPRAIVINVNQKTFNPLDNAFARIHPSIDEIARDDGTEEAAYPSTSGLAQTPDARIDRALGSLWHFYGMRSDIRDALFGDADFATMLLDRFQRWSGTSAAKAAAHRPKPSDFEGTYDLTPLDRGNESYRALDELARTARADGIPLLAVLTPTNHGLLHEYIDNADYRANLATTTALLRKHGANVVNLDTTFAADDFLDNDHLTEAANARFATLLERALQGAT